MQSAGRPADRPTGRSVRSFLGPSAVVKSSTFRISRDYIPFLCSPDAAPPLPPLPQYVNPSPSLVPVVQNFKAATAAAAMVSQKQLC